MVLTRDGLLEDVWGTDFPGETRTVDVHVAEVRKKLGQDGPPIETVRGVGYRLVPPPREPVRPTALRSLGPGWAGRRPTARPTAPRTPRPRGLTARIALAFAGVAIVTWLAIGGTLFIILRGLHAQTTGGRLEDRPPPSPSRPARPSTWATPRACSRRSERTR